MKQDTRNYIINIQLTNLHPEQLIMSSNKMNKAMKYNRQIENDRNNNCDNYDNGHDAKHIEVDEFFKNHVYCGQHAEGYDELGAIIVYHYISKERLGNRKISSIDNFDYDEEIWPGDKLYRYCVDFM